MGKPGKNMSTKLSGAFKGKIEDVPKTPKRQNAKKSSAFLGDPPLRCLGIWHLAQVAKRGNAWKNGELPGSVVCTMCNSL